MATATLSAFQKTLDAVESLPENQQDDLMQIIHRRRIEMRRDELAASIKEAKADFKAGRFKRGTVAEIMKELRSCAG